MIVGGDSLRLTPAKQIFLKKSNYSLSLNIIIVAKALSIS